jgi:predicted acyltransferase
MAATLVAPAALAQTAPVARTVAVPKRVRSIDVLRGLTMAMMILVNDPGDWGHVFRPLDHAEWNGWTPTDLVFPTFLFLVGTSMIFSLSARSEKGDCRKSLTGHLFARTGKLLLLSFVLSYFPRMHWHTLRLYFGVIPRIAICSLLGGLILIATLRMRRRAAIVASVVSALLIGYWILLRWVPVPGAGMPGRDVPFMDQVQNLAAWIDRGVVGYSQRWLHTGSLYNKVRDPEGVLSTLPAVGTLLIGALAGMWMRARREHMQLWLGAAGVGSFIAGEIVSIWFPINKNLWTSSFVLMAAGVAMIALSLLSLLMDDREQPWPKWLDVATWPWFVFGSNAIVAYTTSVVLVKIGSYFHVGPADDRNSLMSWIYGHCFAFHGSTYYTSLAFAVVFVVVCFLPNWYLWHKKWFWKM